ncbi:PrsW family intramembrane metalloprotease [Streptomyces sp. HNM0575]|nr:PrsW family intramembrane metalloprotease [Streptomyces sp. HNM0575]NLU76379.1 PrsW family intramembrane metalloprotease [Streptomyces sp. HNM0575]
MEGWEAGTDGPAPDHGGTAPETGGRDAGGTSGATGATGAPGAGGPGGAHGGAGGTGGAPQQAPPPPAQPPQAQTQAQPQPQPRAQPPQPQPQAQPRPTDPWSRPHAAPGPYSQPQLPPYAQPQPYAPVPAWAQQPRFPAMPASPADWRYRPPAAPSWWHRHRRTLRALTLVTLLALCGLIILGLVREQTGTVGLLVGLGLAVLPVPLLVSAFRWIDGVEPTPWRNHLFAFAWGAFAATLVALLTNTLATSWLVTSFADADAQPRADVLGSTVIAPVVEETAKGAAILLLFFFRRRDFNGVVSGIAIAGITAAGFAFTENVLYLGTAFGEDQLLGPEALHESVTAMTFFIRIVVAPFAHPLFTTMTGIAFGIVAALPSLGRTLRILIPVLGLLTASLLHSIWNGSASLPDFTFLFVYALFMIPVFTALTWLAIWSRRLELRTVRDTLPAYAAAGWFEEPEPWGLASMRARAAARSLARSTHGPTGARTVAEYQHFATSLALLRARAHHGSPAPDFQAREQELLHHLWQRHGVAGPATASAAVSLNRYRRPVSWGGPPAPYEPRGFPAR